MLKLVSFSQTILFNADNYPQIMLSVFEFDYQVEYSQSHTAIAVHQETTIEGYQYYTSLKTAFQSQIFENYTLFILTVGCISVAIYCNY